MAELTSTAEAKVDKDEQEESEVPEDDSEQVNSLGYSVAKEPTHPSVPITSLIANYGAADFMPHLTQFLQSSPNTCHTARAPSATLTLPVYRCLTV